MLRAVKMNSGPVRWKSLLRSATNGLRRARPNLFYPLFFDAESGKFLRAGKALEPTLSRESVEVPEGELIVWPLGNDGRELTWGLGRNTFIQYHA